MKNEAFRDRVDRALSDIAWTEEMQKSVFAALDKREGKPMKKLSAALVFALILMLLTTAVGFATGGFGILQYAPGQAGNQAYLDTILTIGQTYDLGAFSVTVNEAAFDGMRLLTTMEIDPREGEDPVFVLPKVRAKINGEPVETFWQSGTGFYDECGFWAPQLSGEANGMGYPEYGGAEIALWNVPNGENFGNNQIAYEAVEWEIVFDAYKPMLPLTFTEADEPAMDEEPWTEEQYAAHEQLLAQAYEDGKIMLDAYAEPWWYLGCIPQKDGVDGGEKSQEELWQNAVEMGVFRLEKEAVFRFETKPLPVWSQEEQPSFSLPEGFTVTVEKMDVSVDLASLRLKITREDGTPAAPYFSTFDWDFAVLAQGAKTDIRESGCGGVEDGSLQFECTVEFFGPTKEIFIVPCRKDQRAVGTDGVEYSLNWATYQRQEPITEEQKQLMMTIDLE